MGPSAATYAMPEDSEMIEEHAGDLYRALGRPPPRVLATDDALMFVRYVRAVARPAMSQRVVGGCVLAMLAMAAPMLWPAARVSLPPMVAVGGLAWFLATLVWLEGAARPSLPLPVRLLPPALLAVLAMGVGLAAFGTPLAAARGAALIVILYGVPVAAGLMMGALGARLALRRRGSLSRCSPALSSARACGFGSIPLSTTPGPRGGGLSRCRRLLLRSGPQWHGSKPCSRGCRSGSRAMSCAQ